MEEQPGGSLPDIETTRYSVSWLKKWAEEAETQPFFLAVGYHKPHIPLKFPKQFLGVFAFVWLVCMYVYCIVKRS